PFDLQKHADSAPDTNSKHSRACRRGPDHSAFCSPLARSALANCPSASHISPTVLPSHHSIDWSLLLPGRHTPIPPPSVIDNRSASGSPQPTSSLLHTSPPNSA